MSAHLQATNVSFKNDVNKKEDGKDKIRPTSSPKSGYYVENLLRMFKENINDIKELNKNTKKIAKNLDQKTHQELLQRMKLNKENLSKIIPRAEGLKLALANDDSNLELRKELKSLVEDVFELHRQFYQLNLDLRAISIHDYFKINGVELSNEELREILHTIEIRIPQFNDYFKFKTKNKGTDYRTSIKCVTFQQKSCSEALQALLENRDFKNSDSGREKILMVEFPKLSKENFNNLARLVPIRENNAIISHIFWHEKNRIIFFLKDFQAKSMDLHGYSIPIAMEHAKSTIRNIFLRFEDQLTLIPGKGIHSQSGKPGIKLIIINQLAAWQKSDKHFIDSYEIPSSNEGCIKIKFCPPKTITLTEFDKKITNLLQNQEHRIIIKLDKKYSPKELQALAIKLTLKTIMTYPNIGSLFPETSTVECDYVRLFFTYNNGASHLFDFGGDLGSISNTTVPAISMSIPVQTIPPAPQPITITSDRVTNSRIKAKTLSKDEFNKQVEAGRKMAALKKSVTTKETSVPANPMLHLFNIKNDENNTAAPKHRGSNLKKKKEKKSSKPTTKNTDNAS